MGKNNRIPFGKKWRYLLAFLVVVLVGGTAVWWGWFRDRDGITTTPTLTNNLSVTTSGIATTASGAAGSEKTRLYFRLSQGQQPADLFDLLPVASGTPLSPEEIQRILDRMPPLTAVSGDTQEFNLPDDSLPPPRTGDTIQEAFPPPPPPVDVAAADTGPLTVVRYAPEGEIPLAPFLNVTFNQPIVPLTSLESLTAADVPVKLTPEIPGVWKWLSPQILTFEYQGENIDRFPMATTFTAEIPAGTTSATGGVLAESVSWTFSTPPPQLISSFPTNSPQPRNPILFAAFDQLIDPEAVLATIQLRADGQNFPLQLAAAAEIEADDQVSRYVEGAADGRWLAFKSSQTLPADTAVTVTIGPGTPSAEGPRVTETAQTFNFFTYPPLQISHYSCGWYEDECPPLTPFIINFNNPLDLDKFDPTLIAIEPELPGATVDVSFSAITIRGVTRGRTTYRVRVDGDIQDVFGQTMGRNETLRFKVGSAAEALSGLEEPLITLDPSLERPSVSIYTINLDELRLRAYAVTPEDWPDYLQFADQFYQDDAPPPPGQQMLNETIDIDSEADQLTETQIDLSDALDGRFGHLIVIVEPPAGLFTDKWEQRSRTRFAWVQITQIGVDAYTDHSDMTAWATNLQNGAPLADVAIRFVPGGASAQTGADGLARLPLPNRVDYLVAELGEDSAILTNSFWRGGTSWESWQVRDELRWYVFDERQMYRPGEEVHVKGWLRQIGGKQNGDVGLAAVQSVQYQLFDAFGNEVLNGRTDVNALGGFDMAFTLTENMNLGFANLQMQAAAAGGLEGTQFFHSIQVQEFRRPEFEVTAQTETSGPFYPDSQATVSTSANYFAGGPLPNADVFWTVTATPGQYSPPNWSDFIFGEWTPWWYFYGPVYEDEFFSGGPDGGDQQVESFEGVTDAAGNHYLQLDFDGMDGAKPYNVTAAATVMDVNRQAWSSSTSLLVHPSSLYVGLRSDRTFVRQGAPLDIDLIVTDLDGNPQADVVIEVTAARLEWRTERGVWQQVEADGQTCTVASAAEPVTCSFATDKGGEYQITAVVTDSSGRQNLSQFTRWVSGGQQRPARNVEQETVTLIPDKETYQPGDAAEILVQSPFSPAEGLLTVSRSGILTTERFQMTADSYTLRILIEDGHIPNLNVQVDLVGASPRTDDDGEPLDGVPDRPAYATGSLHLAIPPLSRALSLTVTPLETALEPGGSTVIDVEVRDADGRPLSGAELALVVVDEAVLALTNYQLTDPLAAFYTDRPSWLSNAYGRATIILADPESLAEQVAEVTRSVTETVVQEAEVALEAPTNAMMDSDGSFDDSAAKSADAPIQIRTDFNPLAEFVPVASSDSDGRATIPVTLPDNLTRYRVMVAAVAGGKQFGMGESNLTARLPLMVRPSAPRFLNFGDQFEFPIVLQNQTDEPMEVAVVMQTSNLTLTGSAGARVSVPANDRVEVRFPAAADLAGTARFQVAAVSGDYADAASGELPVYTPATTEAFATYGVIDQGAIAQPVAIPDGLFPQFGGLEINTSSTALQSLTDAVLYLTSYRYECSEQLASRILAVAALRDVLTAFEADGLPSPAEMEAAVQRDIERLAGLQNYDGGFPIWERGRESIPYYTIHVTHALARAQQKGFEVPGDVLANALNYLQNIESYYPEWYGRQARWSMSAYALNVRYLAGDTDAVKAANLLNEAGLEDLSLEALAWLWPILDTAQSYAADVAAINRHFQNRAVETAAAANFTTSYGDQEYLMLHSNRRTDGIILEALIAVDPESDLIPKLVNGLLAQRARGRWGNTQENVFILLALDRYFNTFESETPDFVARIWLGDAYAGDHTYAGRTTERHQTDIPMNYLFDVGAADLILSKEGPGRLYYRLGLSYAPDDLTLEPLDMGFTVLRQYEGVDDADDVYRDDDGVWHIKAGARVRVRLTLVTSNRRYHVALVDPLPAGLEIMNPALAVTGDLPQDASAAPTPWWWWGTWYEHQNLRDERAEAFTTLLWEGVYEYSYVTRATTPGTFIAPPAKAEEMYSPEVFGRSASEVVVVE